MMMEDGELVREEEASSNWLGYKKQLLSTVRIAAGIMVALISQMGIQPLVAIIGGRLCTQELDVISVSNSVINSSGVAVVIGMASACDNLFCQAFGGKNFKLVGLNFQRALLITSMALAVCLTLQLNAEPILKLFRQDDEIARLSARYLTLFVPGMCCLFFYEVMKKYVECQGIVLPHAIIGCVGLAAHALYQYILVHYLHWGLDGSAIGQAAGYVTTWMMSLAYILISGVYKETWPGWSLSAFLEWREFTWLAFCGMMMVCIDFWAFELTILLAGMLGQTELAAHSIVFNINQLFFTVPLAISFAVAIRVGQLLGANDPDGARNTGKVGYSITGIFCIILSVVCLTLKKQLPLIFSNDRAVIDIVSNILPIVSGFCLADSIGILSKGICRGSGRHAVAILFSFIGYCVLALPMCACLLFLTPLRTTGLWTGLSIALTVNAGMYIVYVRCYLNWNELAKEAVQRSAGSPFPSYRKTESTSPNEKVSPSDVKELPESTPIIQPGSYTAIERTEIKKNLLILSGSICIIATGIAVRISF